MTPRVHYVSHGYSTGYGVAGFRLVEALAAARTELRWTPISFDDSIHLPDRPRVHGRLDHLREVELDPDVVVVHAPPDLLPAIDRRMPELRRAPLVCHTVWETDRLPRHWAEPLNGCAGVIVPTEWNADVFRASGVTVPIAVVGHAVDPWPDRVDDAWLAGLRDRFVVYVVAEWDARKSPWRVVDAVAAAFGADPDVALLLKIPARRRDGDRRFDGPPAHRADTRFALARHLGTLSGPVPDITLVNRFLTDAELRALHRRGDVWLSLPHAEGWDLGAFDAAVAGTPVITTGWGAPAEYLDPTLTSLVPGRLVDVHVPPDPPEPDHQWVEPDLDEAVDRLRWVREHPEEARRRATAQRGLLEQRFAGPVVAAATLDALAPLVG